MRTTAWLLLLLCCVAPARAQDRPNVLFLFADDLRADHVGAFGGEHAHTPNLDRLAADGTMLTQVYCMGSRHGAVCAPSRAMLMSGRVLTRAPDSMEGCKLLPEWLREAGYATFATGKWHNGDASLTRAFPDARAVFRGGMSDHFEVPLCDVVGGEIVRVRDRAGHSTETFADAVIDFFGRHRAAATGQPFFAYVPFTAPHDPRDPPKRWLDALREHPRPALPENFRGQHGLNLGKPTMTVRDENLLAWPRDPELLRDQLVEYRALVAHLDEQVGRILDALRACGFADNTLVVFTADHGLALGSHGLLGKQSLYEHSMRAPCIVQGPGVPKGAVRDGLCYLLDLMPTVAQAGGLERLPGVDGRSLWPLITNGDEVRDELLLIYSTTQRALRFGKHKLIVYPQINRRALFDVVADPHEQRNLLEGGEDLRVDRTADGLDPVHAELLWRLVVAQKGVGDDLPLTTDDPQPAEIDLSGKRWPADRWQPAWIRAKYW